MCRFFLRAVTLHVLLSAPGLTLLPASASASASAPAANNPSKQSVQVKVTVAIVPESAWQADLAALHGDPTALLAATGKLVADAKLPPLSEVICELYDGAPHAFTNGQMVSMAEGWEISGEDPFSTTPQTEIKKVIGTEVQVKRMFESFDDPIKNVEITLTHLFSKPTSYRVIYGAAAKSEEERLKLSVPLPIFDQLEWKGQVTATHDPRLVASVRRHVDSAKDISTAQRCLIFVQLVTPSARPLSTPPAPSAQQIRQRIYRIPMLDGARLFTSSKAPTGVAEADLVRQLETWQAAGKATLMSDIATTLTAGGSATIADGKVFNLTTELDHDYDRLFLSPTSSQPSQTGATLEVSTNSQSTQEANQPHESIFPGWNSTYVESDPLQVKWPASWLEGKPAMHGWISWYDSLVEKLSTSPRLPLQSPVVVGALPSASHVWDESPSPPAALQMDVNLAEAGPAPGATEREPASDDAAEPLRRAIFTGIAIPSQQAFSLMLQHQPKEDAELLQTLLTQAAAGKAQLRFCTVSSYRGGNRIHATSGRRHHYPTEMPSIPSAWDDRIVGTSIESELGGPGDINVHLDHHLAAPRKQLWSLGIGEPELIMWQPAFRTLDYQASSCLRPGFTRLLGMMKVPAAMTGDGLPGDESLLVFARLDGPLEVLNRRNDSEPADPFAPNANANLPRSMPSSDIHLQVHVFEVPADEIDQWQMKAPPEGQTAASDRERFDLMVKRAGEGSATLAGHGMAMSRSGQRTLISMAEQVVTATEYDPPTDEAPHRMRPTGLDNIPTGTTFEIDPVTGPPTDTTPALVEMNYTITHANARPVEPDLATAIKSIGPSRNDRAARARQYDVNWRGRLIVLPGVPFCLGALADPASITDKSNGKPTKILVAFLTSTLDRWP